MTGEVHFVVDGEPEPKGSTRAVVTDRGVAKVLPDNPHARGWQDLVGYAAKHAMRGEPFLGPVHLIVSFYLSRPKTVTRRFAIAKPDLDKLLRAVLDALTGICYFDDAQVISAHASKWYAHDTHHPCAVIAVTTWPTKGASDVSESTRPH